MHTQPSTSTSILEARYIHVHVLLTHPVNDSIHGPSRPLCLDQLLEVRSSLANQESSDEDGKEDSENITSLGQLLLDKVGTEPGGGRGRRGRGNGTM